MSNPFEIPTTDEQLPTPAPLAPSQTAPQGSQQPAWHAFDPETGQNDIPIYLPQRTDWSRLSDNIVPTGDGTTYENVVNYS